MSAAIVQSRTAWVLRATRTASRGFTLIELMITIAVAAILLAIAIPSYRTMILNNRQDSVVDAAMSALNYARNTALSSDQATTLCPNGGGGVCGATWGAGWLVNTVLPAGVLTTTALKPGGPTVTTVASVLMTFSSRGLVTGSDTFKVCDSRGSAFARVVAVNPIGYVQASQTRGFAVDGITPLVCP